MFERKRIGLLVPSSNTTIEPDFHLTLPDSATVHSHRLWSDIDARKPTAITKLGNEFLESARFLTPIRPGESRIPQGNNAMENQLSRIFDIPLIASSPSALQALRCYGIKRISVITPYDQWANARLCEFFHNFSFEVLSADGDPRLEKAHQEGINAQSPRDIAKFAISICQPKRAEALVLSCSGWRLSRSGRGDRAVLMEKLGHDHEATIWRMLRFLAPTQPNQAMDGCSTRCPRSKTAQPRLWH